MRKAARRELSAARLTSQIDAKEAARDRRDRSAFSVKKDF
jgi:hypothetical protein